MKIFELSHLIEDAIKTAREEHVTVELNNSPFEGVGFPEEILEGMLHQEEGVPSPTETEACRQESLGQHCLIVFGSYGKRSWKFLRGALFSDDTYWLCKGINKKAKIPIDKPWEEDLVIPLTLWCAALTFVCLVAVSYHALFFMVSSIILGLFLLFAIWALIQQRKALRRLSWMLKAERHSRKYLQRKMKVIDIIYAEPLCHVKQAQQPEKVHEKYRPVINYNVNINVDSIQGDIISNGGVKNVTHNHYGNEQSTKVQEGGFEPYIQLLQQMVASYKDEGNWKALLCPYKAAVTEGVLPKWTCKEFCKKMNVKIADSTYSQWMRDGSYTPEELDPYAERFKELELQISPSQRQ